MTARGAGGTKPLVELYVHPDHLLPEGFSLARLGRICQPAAAEVLQVARVGAPIHDLDEVEVTLVNDSIIADVHLEFMSVEGATDVITFDHGEILISTETAAEQAAANQNSLEQETATYLIHGLLHLAGYADKAPADFAEMADLQQTILDRVWPEP